MNTPDLEKEQSERLHSLADFVVVYNQDLPESFPRASLLALKVFQETYPNLFRDGNDAWSLDRHRKKVMDWLPQHVKSLTA